MIGWLETTLGTATQIKQGRYLSKEQMTPVRSEVSPIPVHGANGIIGWTDSPMYTSGVPLVTCRGSNSGMVLWADGPLWVSNNSMAILPCDEIDIGFLYYFLLFAPPYQFVSGSAQPQITVGDLSRKIISYPPLPEQREIASILGALDDKIELNRRMAGTLEEMARALYRSWFVDFDPVKAKAEGLAPAFMDEATAALFPDRFGDDGLPEGWKRGALIDLSSLNPEKWGTRNAPDMVVYVDLSNTKWGVIEATTTYSWTEAPSRARMVLQPGDTIVGTVRPGNGSYAYVAEAGLTGSTGFAVLRPNRSNDAALVNLAATDADNIASLTNLADGGAYPAVRPEVVGASEVVIAAEMVRDAFAAQVIPIVNRIEEAKRESRSLATLRDTLLPKLMSGELRVGEARDQIEEVA